MSSKKLDQMIRDLNAKLAAKEVTQALPDYSEYTNDPVSFISKILKIKLTLTQEKVCRSVAKKNSRVMCRSGHALGKSAVCCFLAIWFFCTRPRSIVIITAPNYDQIGDTIFKEIRRFIPEEYRKYILPKDCRLFHNHEHFIKGKTSKDSTGFQGTHDLDLLILIDEQYGVDKGIFDAIGGITAGGTTHILGVGNPTSTESAAYQIEMSGAWEVIQMNTFEHPNIIAELNGEEPPIPSAVRLENLEINMNSWGDWVTEEDHNTHDYGYTDVLFKGRYWRPNLDGHARILGSYPPMNVSSIFSEHDFKMAWESKTTYENYDNAVISCDVARFGNDFTSITVRKGWVVISHETFQGQSTDRTFKKLIELCQKYGNERPDLVPVIIDDASMGGAIVDFGKDKKYNFIGLNSACNAVKDQEYNNVRSELMFMLKEYMREGLLNLSGLPRSTFNEIKRQGLGILYSLDNRGRRVAEQKKDTKKRIGRSPDDLDSLCLCVYPIEKREWKTQDIVLPKTNFEERLLPQNPLFQSTSKKDPDRQGWH